MSSYHRKTDDIEELAKEMGLSFEELKGLVDELT